MLLEISNNSNNCVLFYNNIFENNNFENNNYICKNIDKSHICICNEESHLNPFLMSLGSVGSWHHYAPLDTTYQRNYYIIPAYGTPVDTVLVELYNVIYGSLGESVSDSNSLTSQLGTIRINKSYKIKFLKDIKC